MKLACVLVLCLLCMSSLLPAAVSRALRIGVVNNTMPFVFVSPTGRLEGFDIDTMKALMQTEYLSNYSYEFDMYHSLSDLNKAMDNNQTDMAISALVPSDALTATYSSPYFNSGLQILVPANADATEPLSRALGTPLMAFLLLVYVLGLVVFAHAIWICERSANEDFRKPYLQGVFDGLYWCSLTAAMGGLGDKCPETVLGKICTILATFWGVLMTALVIAVISSSLNSAVSYDQVRGLSDLANHRVGVIQYRSALAYVQGHLAAEIITYDTLPEAIAALLSKKSKIFAIVDSAPMLVYLAQQPQYSGQVNVVGQVFAAERFAIAFPLNSPLVDLVNAALARYLGSSQAAVAYQAWFNPVQQQVAAVSGMADKAHVPDAWLVSLAWTCFCICVVMILTCLGQFVYRKYHRLGQSSAGEDEALLGQQEQATAAAMQLVLNRLAELTAVVQALQNQSVRSGTLTPPSPRELDKRRGKATSRRANTHSQYASLTRTLDATSIDSSPYVSLNGIN